MQPKDLTIIIVTYKSDEKIFNCLKSIPDDLSVIIVENSNSNTFKEKIEENFTNVKCILTGENKGYSAANNIGLKLAKSKYALVLNPDTVLDKTAIKHFFLSTSCNNDFWLMGPGNDQDKNLDFENKNLLEVENLKGFAIFFNLSKFNQEFFDENFFLFFEEIDLCRRVKNISGKIFLDKNIVIKHEGASSVTLDNSLELEKNRNWHWMWSTFYYQKKYKGFIFALLLIFPKLLSAFFRTVFYLMTFNNKKRDIYFCRLSGLLNSIIGKKAWYRPSID